MPTAATEDQRPSSRLPAWAALAVPRGVPGGAAQGPDGVVGTRLMQGIGAAFPAAEGFELFTGERSAGNLRLYERLGYRPFRTEALSPQVTLVFLEKRRVAPG